MFCSVQLADETVKGLPVKLSPCESMALELLDRIYRLSAIEHEFKQSTPGERLNARNIRRRPLVEELQKWLDDMASAIIPKSLPGKAAHYGGNNG